MVTHDPAPPPGTAESAGVRVEQQEPERRHLTALFCDLVGFTALSRQLDPEDLRLVLRSYQDACTKIIARYDGQVSRYFGDGILVLFGYPRAHEDDAERAARAALEIVETLSTLSLSPRRGTSVTLAVRVGMATGLVVAGDLIGEGASEEQAIVGETPNLAARLMGAAEPNTAVAAESTHKLLGERFEYDDLGKHELKGFPDPVPVYRLVRVARAQSRFSATHKAPMTPLIGREGELEVLSRCWDKAKAARGQIVSIVGEAGIGKSRLAQEFRGRLASEPHAFVHYQCFPYYRNTALYPTVRQLEWASGFKPEDSREEKRAKLRALVRQSVASVDETMPFFAELLNLTEEDESPLQSLNAQQVKAQVLDALWQQVEGLARQQALLLTWEDVHWLDPTSYELLQLIAARGRNLPILLLLTYRPEEYQWAEDDVQANATRLSLERLPPESCAALVDQVISDEDLPASWLKQIIDKGDGIPLYLEEITKAVLETRRSENGRVEGLTSTVPVDVIPDSLHDSLMARLDRLGAGKTVAQIGSVLGREFSQQLLAAVSELGEDEVQLALARLVESGILTKRGDSAEAIYSFRHALMRDAAYEALLLRKRERLHGRIAVILEERFPHIAQAQPELVARHFTGAGLTAKAIQYWLKAGKRASEHSANEEAAAHLDKGLSLLADLSDTAVRRQLELDLHNARGVVFIMTEGARSAEAEQEYQRALKLCEEVPQAESHFAAHWGWWRVSMDHRTGRLRANTLLSLATSLGGPGLTMQAHHSQWATLFMLGEHEACCQHIVEGLNLYDEREHRGHAAIYAGHDPRVCAYGERALSKWLLGQPDRATDAIGQAISWATELGHSTSLAHAKDYELMLHRFRRDPSMVLTRAEELVSFANRQGFRDYRAKGELFRGWARAQLGETERGLAEMQCAMQALEETATEEDFPVYYEMLAEVQQAAGDFEAAEHQIVEGLKLADRKGICFWNAELHRRKAALMAGAGEEDNPEVEKQLRLALDAAARQNARPLALRAATTLAHLRAKQGQLVEARQILRAHNEACLDELELMDLRRRKRY